MAITFAEWCEQIERDPRHAHGRPSDHRMVPRISCLDGFNVSVQASAMHYSTPQYTTRYGNYSRYEIGFPSQDEPLLEPYAERYESGNETGVYPYVPRSVVEQIISKHGGIRTPDDAKLKRRYTFKAYSDPGHSWIRVPMSLLEELGIDRQISRYSYASPSGKYAYLEEDMDWGTFYRAIEGRTEFDVNVVIQDKPSHIRRYPTY